MAHFKNVKVPLGQELRSVLKSLDPGMNDYRILKKSLDARNSRNIRFVYEVETLDKGDFAEEHYPQPKRQPRVSSPEINIVGAGPAGLFAALWLVESGLKCRLLERGKPVIPRMKDIAQHWRHANIVEDSNVCFGEGGAGAFSDGKLVTRIKSPFKRYVLKKMVQFGAPESILYDSAPHVGSNKIRSIIRLLREYLQEQGCEVLFEHRVSAFETNGKGVTRIYCSNGAQFNNQFLVLATGHSAHDIYSLLFEHEIQCETVNVAMGFRIEHPQLWLNKTQYGESWNHPDLPVASYRIVTQDKDNEMGTYSFCMCPGGYVLASSAQKGNMVVNGMSNSNHASGYANSGLVVTVDKNKWFPEGPRQGLEFQSNIERAAQEVALSAGATREVPAQNVLDFLEGRVQPVLKSSCPSGVVPADMTRLFPKAIHEAFSRALLHMNQKMPGFVSEQAVLHGVETRTSSPIRVLRDKESFNSPSWSNLFPCGEGAGYAGGITSAAVDGIKVAESLLKQIP